MKKGRKKEKKVERRKKKKKKRNERWKGINRRIEEIKEGRNE